MAARMMKKTDKRRGKRPAGGPAPKGLGIYKQQEYLPLAPVAEAKLNATNIVQTVDNTSEVSATQGTGLLLVGIAEGVTALTRIGHRIRVRRIYGRGYAILPTQAAPAAVLTDVWIIQDRQANGAVPALATVMYGNVGATHLLNHDQIGRFKVLHHKQWTHTPNAGITSSLNAVVAPWEFDIKLNMDVQYNAAAGALTEITNNNIFFVWGSTGDDVVTVTASAYVEFTDA